MFFHQGAQLAELFTQVSDRLRMGTWGQGVRLGGVLDHRGFLHSKGWLGPSFDGFQLLGLQGLGGGLLQGLVGGLLQGLGGVFLVGSHGMVQTRLGLEGYCDQSLFVVYYFSATRHLYLCQLCSDFSHDDNND